MSADFLSTLRERGVRLTAENGQLKCDAPPGVLDDELRAELAARKDELLALIAGAESMLGGPRSVVPLKPTGELPPLFARPGHNGDVFCYRALAEHIGPRRPLYGVEPKGVDGNAVPETVEEIAAYEVEQIREVQAEGPYYIAGYCAGGAIAFESARQLADAGLDVARVVLLGSPFPTVFRTGAAQMRSLNFRMRGHAAALTGGSIADGLDHVRSRARARMNPALANRRRVERATMTAVKRFDPKFYAGRIDVFFPSEAWRHSGDRPDEWKRVAGHVVEHVGPDGCDSEDMLREPHVQVLVTLLEHALRDEEEGNAAN